MSLCTRRSPAHKIIMHVFVDSPATGCLPFPCLSMCLQRPNSVHVLFSVFYQRNPASSRTTTNKQLPAKARSPGPLFSVFYATD